MRIPSTKDAQSDVDELLGGSTPSAVPSTPDAPAPQAAPEQRKQAAPPRATHTAAERKLNAYVDPAVQEAIKRAQFWTQTQREGYRTLSDLVEDVLRAKAEELQDLYNNGEPFDEIPDGRLRAGRPVGR